MGQAKNRWTYEERKAQAIEREKGKLAALRERLAQSKEEGQKAPHKKQVVVGLLPILAVLLAGQKR